ncbi:hypothetical protein BH20ACT15_BH20ACT15_11400 [soil metagenome]
MGRSRSFAGAAALAFALITAVAATTSESGANQTFITEAQPTSPAGARSIAVGKPTRGSLIFSVQLAAEGPDFFTWDFPRRTSPNRAWRRWGTDTALMRTLTVIAEHRAANPGAPRAGIADVSRRSGGPFGKRFGGLGHASHQNGLDVDVLYPRRDHQEAVAPVAKLIDRRLSQDLLDRFVAAGARYAFVGRRTKLKGPKKIVQRIPHHDDHIHVRWRPGR